MMRWRRRPEVIDYFSPQKWEVNACFMWSSYSVVEFIDNQPCWLNKNEWHPHHRRIMDPRWLHVPITYRMWNAAQTISSWNRLNLVSSLSQSGLCLLNVLLELGLINIRICFLEVLTDSEFWILLSSVFHSITVYGKK